MDNRKPVNAMEKIRCKTCGSIGYSASRDVQCTRCGNSKNEIVEMDRINKRTYTTDTIHYLQGLEVGNVKPGSFC